MPDRDAGEENQKLKVKEQKCGSAGKSSIYF